MFFYLIYQQSALNNIRSHIKNRVFIYSAVKVFEKFRFSIILSGTFDLRVKVALIVGKAIGTQNFAKIMS